MAVGDDVEGRGTRTEHATAEPQCLHGALRVHELHEGDLCGVAAVAQQPQPAHVTAALEEAAHLAPGHLDQVRGEDASLSAGSYSFISHGW
jgi:hypothetical protein